MYCLKRFSKLLYIAVFFALFLTSCQKRLEEAKTAQEAAVLASLPKIKLISLSMYPPSVTVPKGIFQNFKLIGNYSDGTQKPIDPSNSISWTFSSPVTVDDGTNNSTSDVSFVNNGKNEINIKASSHTFVSNQPNVVNISAKGTFCVGCEVSEAIGILSIIPAQVTDLSLRATDMAASFNAPPAIVNVGLSKQFIAEGSYSDASANSKKLDLSSTVSWTVSCSNPSNPLLTHITVLGGVVTVDKTASASTEKFVLTATLQNFKVSTQFIIGKPVAVSLEINPQNPNIELGNSTTLTASILNSDGSHSPATAETIIWSSSNQELATVTGNTVTAIVQSGQSKKGIVTIRAQQSAIQGSILVSIGDAILKSIQVTPTSVTLAVGKSQQFNVVGIMSDGSQVSLDNAIWSLDKDHKNGCTINNGLLTINPNIASNSIINVYATPILLTASVGKSFTATAAITIAKPVPSSLLVLPQVINLPMGTPAMQLSSENSNNFTSVSDNMIKIVSRSNTITAFMKMSDDLFQKEKLKSITWSSSDSNIVTIDGNDRLIPIKQGLVTISAVYNDGISPQLTASATVNVTSGPTDLKFIVIAPVIPPGSTSIDAVAGLEVELKAYATYYHTPPGGTNPSEITKSPYLVWAVSDGNGYLSDACAQEGRGASGTGTCKLLFGVKPFIGEDSVTVTATFDVGAQTVAQQSTSSSAGVIPTNLNVIQSNALTFSIKPAVLQSIAIAPDTQLSSKSNLKPFIPPSTSNSCFNLPTSTTTAASGSQTIEPQYYRIFQTQSADIILTGKNTKNTDLNSDELENLVKNTQWTFDDQGVIEGRIINGKMHIRALKQGITKLQAVTFLKNPATINIIVFPLGCSESFGNNLTIKKIKIEPSSTRQLKGSGVQSEPYEVFQSVPLYLDVIAEYDDDTIAPEKITDFISWEHKPQDPNVQVIADINSLGFVSTVKPIINLTNNATETITATVNTDLLKSPSGVKITVPSASVDLKYVPFGYFTFCIDWPDAYGVISTTCAEKLRVGQEGAIELSKVDNTQKDIDFRVYLYATDDVPPPFYNKKFYDLTSMAKWSISGQKIEVPTGGSTSPAGGSTSPAGGSTSPAGGAVSTNSIILNPETGIGRLTKGQNVLSFHVNANLPVSMLITFK